MRPQAGMHPSPRLFVQEDKGGEIRGNDTYPSELATTGTFFLSRLRVRLRTTVIVAFEHLKSML
jgi:hypothetical protein